MSPGQKDVHRQVWRPILVTVVVVFIATIATVTILNQHTEVERQRTNTAERIQGYTLLVASFVAVADFQKLRTEIAPSILADENIVGISVETQFGTEILDIRGSEAVTETVVRELYHVDIPDRHIGQLLIDLSIQPHFLDAISIPILLITLLSFLVIAYVVSRILTRRILAPIEQIGLAVDAFDTTQNSETSPWKPEISDAPEELASLSDAFAQTLMRLSKRTEALEQTNLSLLEQTDARDKAQELLVQARKMEAVGLLTGGIAHDFNNILAVILGNIELSKMALMKQPLDERATELYLEEAIGATLKATQFVRRLLAFGRGDASEPMVLNVGRLLNELEVILLRAVGTQVELDISTTGPQTFVFSDAAGLESAIVNLVKNASQSISGIGKVKVESTPVIYTSRTDVATGPLEPGSYVAISVSDTGHGMDVTTAERAFSTYFTTKEKGVGTGLGLTSVTEYVHAQGGRVDLKTAPGEGSTFTLFLPATKPDQGQMAQSIADDGTRSLGMIRASVLIIEDNDSVAGVLKGIFEQFGCRVIIRSDYSEILNDPSILENVQLVLSDYEVPSEISFDEFARFFKKSNLDCKLVVMTGTHSIDTVLQKVDPYGFKLLSKPIPADDLFDLIVRL